MWLLLIQKFLGHHHQLTKGAMRKASQLVCHHEAEIVSGGEAGKGAGAEEGGVSGVAVQ